jgi:hypothetical protein
VARDEAQDVHRGAGIGHPGQSGMAQGVAAEVFEAECAHDLVSVGGVAEDRCGDAAAAGSGEQSRVSRP